MSELTQEEKEMVQRMVALANKGTKKSEEPKVDIVDSNIDNESMVARLVRLSGLGHLVQNKDKQEEKLVGDLDPVQVLREAIKEVA